jgi:hypothetical protein
MSSVLTELLNKDVVSLINEYLMISEEEVRAHHHRAMNQLMFNFGVRRTSHYLNALYPIVYKVIHYSSARKRMRFRM